MTSSIYTGGLIGAEAYNQSGVWGIGLKGLTFTGWKVPDVVYNDAVVWLDAADQSTISESGGRVSQISDKSASGFDHVQATAALQPLTNNTTQNGLNVLEFDDNTRCLELSNSSLFQNVSAGTIIAALKGTAWTAAVRNHLYSIGNNATSSRFLMAVNASGKYETGGRRLDANSFQSVSSSANASTNWEVRRSEVNYSTRALNQYIDEVIDGNSTTFQSSGSTSNTASANTRLNSTSAGIPGAGGAMLLGELLVFHKVLSGDESAAVFQYLNDKWAI